MAWSTLEQLKALRAKTPAQKEALRRADYALCEKYPARWVAFTDEWKGEELVRTVLVAAAEVGPFYEQVDQLPPEVRARLQCTRIPDPDVYELRPEWSE
jgi:hypothetical protein